MSEEAAFTVTLQDASAFKELIGAATATLKEVGFNVDDSGLTIYQMDDEHVSLVDAYIPSNIFDEWSLETAGTIRLNVQELKRMLDKVMKREVIVLEANPGKERLYMRLREPGKRSSRKFDLKLLEPYIEEVPSPTLIHKVVTTIKVAPLLEAVKDVLLVTDFLRIRATPDLFEVYGEGDKGYAYNTWSSDAEDLTRHSAEEETDSTYNVDKFMDLVNPCRGAAEKVTLRLSHNMPLHLEYEVKQGAATKLTMLRERPRLNFYLAPMVV